MACHRGTYRGLDFSVEAVSDGAGGWWFAYQVVGASARLLRERRDTAEQAIRSGIDSALAAIESLTTGFLAEAPA